MAQTAKKEAVVETLPALRTESYQIMEAGELLRETLFENMGGDGMSVRDFDTVKVPTGGITVFTVPGPNGEEHMSEIEGVIIHHCTTRAYYKEEFSGGGTPPDCSSPDGITGLGDIGDGSMERACEGCPMNRFGSGKDDAKACSERRMIFVAMPERAFPIVIAAPPGSLSSTREYFRDLGKHHLKLYYNVVTRFTLRKERRKKGGMEYSVLHGEMIGTVDNPVKWKQLHDDFAKMISPSIQQIINEASDRSESNAVCTPDPSNMDGLAQMDQKHMDSCHVDDEPI
jgi:hypothetical protein